MTTVQIEIWWISPFSHIEKNPRNSGLLKNPRPGLNPPPGFSSYPSSGLRVIYLHQKKKKNRRYTGTFTDCAKSRVCASDRISLAVRCACRVQCSRHSARNRPIARLCSSIFSWNDGYDNYQARIRLSQPSRRYWSASVAIGLYIHTLQRVPIYTSAYIKIHLYNRVCVYVRA